MTLTLHTVSGAPRPWRVILGLVFKELPFDINYMSLAAGDLRSDAFLALNPRSTIPVLETGGLVLRDSIGILAWLDRAYPEDPLFGDTTEQAALIWQVTLECCDYLRAAQDQLLRGVFSGDGSAPASGSDDETRLKAAAEGMFGELSYLETLLKTSSYLADRRPSAADAVAYPEFRLIRRALETKPVVMGFLGFGNIDEKYPRLAAWRQRIEDIPGVREHMPPHWGE